MHFIFFYLHYAKRGVRRRVDRLLTHYLLSSFLQGEPLLVIILFFFYNLSKGKRPLEPAADESLGRNCRRTLLTLDQGCRGFSIE